MDGSPWRRWTCAVFRWAARGAGGRRFFVAALDAAAGRVWEAEAIGEETGPARWATQRRWVERGAGLLGLTAACEQTVAAAVAERLGVSGTEHRQARARFQGSRRLVEHGAAVASVVGLISARDDLWPRVACALDLVGEWGTVWLWEPGLYRCSSPFAALARQPP